MCAFSTETLDPTILDPRKRVRYATGLVLGVDEFLQDQTYLMERDRRHQRALHGYGTVHGLDVRARVREGQAEITVAPGVAVDPTGRDVCVPALQCARLDAWLAENADEVEAALGAGSFPDGSFPDGPAALYVVLCHRECETDVVPLPGSPCRSEDDALVASRIADRFELRITATPPAAVEEAATRRFGQLLRRLRVGDEGPPLSADALAARVRALPEAEGDGDAGPLFLPTAAAADLVRLAFRVWTVEVRPRLGGEGACAAPADACVLLARLDLDVVTEGDGYRIDAEAPAGPGGVPGVAVRQSGRPFLLSTRVLQEWLAHFCGCPAGGPGSFPESFPDVDVVLALNDLLDVEAAPADGDVLTWDGDLGVWVAAPPEAGAAVDHGALVGLADDDHPQYHTDARGDARYAPLGHAHSFPTLTDLDAGGDLTDLYPNPTVSGLQGRPVSAAAPAANQVLRWTGSQWAPATLPAGDAEHEEGLVRIVAMNWRHDGALAPDDLAVEVDGDLVRGLVVAFGFEEPQDGGTVLVNDDSLDDQSFQLFREARDPEFPQNPEFYTLTGVRPSLSRDDQVIREVLPVSLDSFGAAPWVVRTTSPEEPAEAALFPLSSRAADALLGRTLRVVIHGDAVVDGEGRALDAEFPRSEAPTGDRRAGARRGTQGGRFESWFRYLAEGVGRIDPNLATLDELLSLEGVGRGRARRLLEARAGGAVFRSVDDLVERGGLPRGVADALADRLRFDS